MYFHQQILSFTIVLLTPNIDRRPMAIHQMFKKKIVLKLLELHFFVIIIYRIKIAASIRLFHLLINQISDQKSFLIIQFKQIPLSRHRTIFFFWPSSSLLIKHFSTISNNTMYSTFYTNIQLPPIIQF